MQINGSQRNQLLQAIISAYPSKADLEMMIDFELEENLDAIAGGENYRQVVYKLIKWAEASGKLDKLIGAACNNKPGNKKLKDIKQKLVPSIEEEILWLETRIDSSIPPPQPEPVNTPSGVRSPTPAPTRSATSSPQQLPEPDEVEVELLSEKGVDYTKLRDLLATGKWKEADQETSARMLQAMKKSKWIVTFNDLLNFPCTDLRTINSLWLKSSNGKFGFSVQKDIWIEVGGTPGKANAGIFKKFCKRIGWSKRGRFGQGFKKYDELTFNINAPRGHLPLLVMVWRNWNLWLVWLQWFLVLDGLVVIFCGLLAAYFEPYNLVNNLILIFGGLLMLIFGVFGVFMPFRGAISSLAQRIITCSAMAPTNNAHDYS